MERNSKNTAEAVQVYNALREILKTGKNAEVKKNKTGEIVIYAVDKKIMKYEKAG
jgi:hypothetical protein